MFFNKIDLEVKAFLNKINYLLYTPEVQHPVLEDVRKMLVAEIQAHLDTVMKATAQLGNNILQELEKTLQPAAAKKKS